MNKNNAKELTHLSLFTGIGGLDLSGEWAGFRTVGQCEWADYPRDVLEKHWPDVPRWRDIRTLTGRSFYDQTGLRTVTVLSGGFPCQPFSTAGKRQGKDDDRYLWPEMLRVIQEIRPTWVIGENVAGIVSMELDTVLSNLESIGYTCQAFVIPACAVDAPHRRDRVAIVAHTNNSPSTRQREYGGEVLPKPESEGSGLRSRSMAYTQGERCGETGCSVRRSEEWFAGSSTALADTNGRAMRHDSNDRRTSDREIHEAIHAGVFGGAGETDPHTDRHRLEKPWVQRLPEEQGVSVADICWWPVEPDVGRVAHGIPFRVDKLRCLGNAVVPQQFYPIFRAIAELELDNK